MAIQTSKFGRLFLPTLLALAAIVATLVACGGNGDTTEDRPTGTGAGQESSAASPAATPVAATQTGAELTTEEYAQAVEETLARGDDKVEAASSDFFLNGVFSQDEGERIYSLETSESWSDDDAEFASWYAETLLQAVTGLYDLVASSANETLDEVSRLRPPEHLSDLHSNFIATAREVIQFIQAQLETVKSADTEIKNREELADFGDVVNSLESGPLDPAAQQRAEELTARGDAACLALKEQLEAELERQVSICGGGASSSAPPETLHPRLRIRQHGAPPLHSRLTRPPPRPTGKS